VIEKERRDEEIKNLLFVVDSFSFSLLHHYQTTKEKTNHLISSPRLLSSCHLSRLTSSRLIAPPHLVLSPRFLSSYRLASSRPVTSLHLISTNQTKPTPPKSHGQKHPGTTKHKQPRPHLTSPGSESPCRLSRP